MRFLKQLFFIELMVMIVVLIVHLTSIVLGKPFPLAVYWIIFVWVLVFILLIKFVIIPLSEWIDV